MIKTASAPAEAAAPAEAVKKEPPDGDVEMGDDAKSAAFEQVKKKEY